MFPHSPGVYRYYDAEGNVIYVGKAKDLHKRVAQYFVSPDRLTRKTAVMVSKIADAQYTVVETEADALLLENNLIKQFKPRYNILLKDSKTYPWICVSRDEFPKVFLTRKMVRDGSRYFGPYSSVVHARNLVEFIHTVYPLRQCKHKITSDVILRRKIRPCTYFHVKKCLGCCVGGISQQEYNQNIEEIVSLLKGGGREVIQHYKKLMTEAAAALEFEQAEVYKKKMQSLENHYSKSVIANAAVGDVDVFSLITDGPEAFGNFMRIRGGAVIQSLNLGFKLMIEEEQESVLATFIAEIQSKFGELSREIIVPFLPDMEMDGVDFRVPVRGDKLALLELSARNAKEMRLNALKQQEHTDPDAYRNMVMESLQKQLNMPVLPVHIECFDNSNIQGTNPVSACVVFRDAVPAKKDYRHFKVKTVVGANDYATMKEAVNRRYARMLEENPEDLPQLIVIDGGKGQLSSVLEIMETIDMDIPVFGMVKDDYHKTRALVTREGEVNTAREREVYVFLYKIQEEVHRFTVSRMSAAKRKTIKHSSLEKIHGIGAVKAKKLLAAFGSLSALRSATVEQIAAVKGISTSDAESVVQYFKETNGR